MAAGVSLCGRCAAVDGRIAVGDLTGSQLLITVHPCDGVCIESRRIGGCKNGVRGNGVHCRTPAAEGICILRIGGAGRGIAFVRRHSAAVFDIGNLVQFGSVIILPCDRIGVDALGILRIVGRCTGHGGRRVSGCVLPAAESIGMPRVARFGRGSRGIGGDSTILDLGCRKHCIAVHPCNGVCIGGRRVGCLIGHVTRDGGDCRRPAVEGISILRVGGLRGRRAVIARDRAVGDVCIRL